MVQVAYQSSQFKLYSSHNSFHSHGPQIRHIHNQISSTSGIHQVTINILHESDPTASLTNLPFQQYKNIPAWIKNCANSTIILHGMPKPNLGTLDHYKNLNWDFKNGNSQKNETITIQDFQQNAYSLIHSKQLFQGHLTFTKIITAKRVNILQDTVSQHISAMQLRYFDIPTKLKLKKLSNHDITFVKVYTMNIFMDSKPTCLECNNWTWIPRTTSSCGRNSALHGYINHKIWWKWKPQEIQMENNGPG